MCRIFPCVDVQRYTNTDTLSTTVLLLARAANFSSMLPFVSLQGPPYRAPVLPTLRTYICTYNGSGSNR